MILSTFPWCYWSDSAAVAATTSLWDNGLCIDGPYVHCLGEHFSTRFSKMSGWHYSSPIPRLLVSTCRISVVFRWREARDGARPQSLSTPIDSPSPTEERWLVTSSHRPHNSETGKIR